MKMNIRNKKTIAVAAAMAMVIVSGLSSCKGRTMENMEPTGDTVEVVIETPETDTTSRA